MGDTRVTKEKLTQALKRIENLSIGGDPDPEPLFPVKTNEQLRADRRALRKRR